MKHYLCQLESFHVPINPGFIPQDEAIHQDGGNIIMSQMGNAILSP